MSINESPADRSLTLSGQYSRHAERQAIADALPAFFAAGGVLSVYDKGARFDQPSYFLKKVGDATVLADALEWTEHLARNKVRNLRDDAAKLEMRRQTNASLTFWRQICEHPGMRL